MGRRADSCRPSSGWGAGQSLSLHVPRRPRYKSDKHLFFFLIYLFFIQLNAFVLVYWESYGDLTTGNKCFNNPPHSKTLTKAVKLTIKLFLNKRNSSNHSQLFIFLIQLCLIKPALLLGFTIYCLMSSEYLTEKLPHKYYITVLWSSVTFTVDTMSLFNIAVPWC